MEQSTSRRIKEMEVMVADVIIETPDTTTLVLFTGNDRLEYLAGHFLTIDPHQFESLERFTSFLEDLKGKREPPRAYSMSSAPHERYLAVTVKEERATVVTEPDKNAYRAKDLAPGSRVIFAATGVTDGTLMKGVRFFGDGVRTSSLIMQNDPPRIRFIDSINVTPSKDVKVHF